MDFRGGLGRLLGVVEGWFRGKKSMVSLLNFSSDHREREIKSSTLYVRVQAFSRLHSEERCEASHAHVV